MTFRTRVAVGAISLVVMVGSAMAQPGGGGPGRGFGGDGEMFAPPVTTRDVARYADLLALDEDQRVIVDTLFEGYMEEFQASAKAARDRMESIRNEFRDNQDPSVWQGMRKVMDDFRAARDTMEKSFQSDVKTILNEPQIERWPRLERAMRRESTMRGGRIPMMVPGERVDLFRVLEDAEVPQDVRDSLGAVLEQYEIDLDRQIIARNEQYESGFQQMEAIRDSGDMEKMQEVIEKGRDVSMRVRDVNQRFARQIEGLLPDEFKPAFETQLKRASYPDVYRPTRGQRLFEQVMGFTDLDPEQRAGIEAAKASYDRDLKTLNERMATAMDDRVKDFSAERMMSGRGWRDDGTRDLRRERGDLDRETVAKVKSILSDDQQSRIKEPEEDEEGRGDGERRRRRDDAGAPQGDAPAERAPRPGRGG